MRRLVMTVAVVGLGLAVAAWWLSGPDPLPPEAMAGLEGDAAAGEAVFLAAGCASCHLRKDSETLGGGNAFVTQFGTFYAPNISMHPEQGIGGWTQAAFANAVIRGISPGGAHYYPAFPYTSYSLMAPQDAADLWAYMRDLPEDPTPSLAHDLGFPFNIRRSLGLWKVLYMPQGYHLADAPDVPDAEMRRGRYLVEVLGHCAECHTPRDALGGLDRSAWMAGAPNPSGPGRIPGLTPDILTWSAQDIAYYLESGFTPDFDVVGGSMAAVVRNLARLPASDRAAIAAYLKALPPAGGASGGGS